MRLVLFKGLLQCAAALPEPLSVPIMERMFRGLRGSIRGGWEGLTLGRSGRLNVRQAHPAITGGDQPRGHTYASKILSEARQLFLFASCRGGWATLKQKSHVNLSTRVGVPRGKCRIQSTHHMSTFGDRTMRPKNNANRSCHESTSPIFYF